MHTKALELRVAYEGEKDPSVASCHVYLGNTYLAADQIEKATQHFEKALDIRLEIFGPYHVETAACFSVRCFFLCLAYSLLLGPTKNLFPFPQAIGGVFVHARAWDAALAVLRTAHSITNKVLFQHVGSLSFDSQCTSLTVPVFLCLFSVVRRRSRRNPAKGHGHWQCISSEWCHT